jgi:hypothetical protein
MMRNIQSIKFPGAMKWKVHKYEAGAAKTIKEIFVADSINPNGALQVVDIFGIQDPTIHHQTFPYLTRTG